MLDEDAMSKLVFLKNTIKKGEKNYVVVCSNGYDKLMVIKFDSNYH